MGYYDFDYFWTHQEVGGQKLEREDLEAKQESTLIQKILEFIFGEDNHIVQKSQVDTKSRQMNDSELKID